MTFSPMLDVSRDIRWGRTAEGSGEDTWLAVHMARAKVKGYEGSDLTAADSLGGVCEALLRICAGAGRTRIRAGGYFGADADGGARASF